MDSPLAETSSTGTSCDQEFSAGVRLIVLNLPEDEGEGLGFRLTRTLWDPYPWVREVVSGARADIAGLKVGDCLLQADGKDLLGLPIGQVAGLIRGDGSLRGVSLLVWNCGVDPKDEPELLWSCGGGSRGERSRRALSGVVKALACCVCAATAVRALTCRRSHLYCEGCWTRLERCALCREQLPPKDSPYARNLVAEQVFEAIATEYEIKDTIKRPTETASAYASPNRSPHMSPATNRKAQYQLSMMKKKSLRNNERFGQNFASDPNIHRSYSQELRRTPIATNSTNPAEVSHPSSTSDGGKCCCQNVKQVPIQMKHENVPKITIEDTENMNGMINTCHNLQHKLIARLRQASSLADLQNAVQSCICPVSRSLNNVNMENCKSNEIRNQTNNSLENLKSTCSSCDSQPVFVLSAPPIYVVTCEHVKN